MKVTLRWGCCGGLTGGTKAIDYLSETCCSCPHLVLGCNQIRKEKENDIRR